MEKINKLFGNLNTDVVDNLVDALEMFLKDAEHLYEDMKNEEHEVAKNDLDATRMLIKRAGELYLVLSNN